HGDHPGLGARAETWKAFGHRARCHGRGAPATIATRSPDERPRSSTMTTSALRDFLEIRYEQLEEMNLAVKQARHERKPIDQQREERVRYLTDEKRIKAVTVCFTDLEGRLH